ncbi:ycf20-like protein [Telopea speciosissima]|uniref:ycf20-like protein n=1 Tax=Telopea speciosissima TaxID=54955 RepID=UPI001CC8299C|nr:ycf20-like protein [Telopea speciosissima]XP_043716156.1 ycf20-like protein [Telopea speciosissima]
MATKMSLLPKFARNTNRLSPMCLRSRVLVVNALHRNAFAFSWELYPQLVVCRATPPSSVYSSKRVVWSVRSSMGGGGRLEPPSESSTNGGTRLVRAIQDFRIRLNARIQELKKGFPVKVLFFLVGFYCATAFATVIGQTGDWDILSAGLAVVVVEGIGALMYRTSFPLLEKVRSLVTVFNYWKAGLSLGLFLDAFKYEMDNVLELCNPFNFDKDVFSIFF